MKKLLLIAIVTIPLFSFELDFSLPPVIEETFNPSALGEEVPNDTVYEEPTIIAAEPVKEEINLSPTIVYASYPKIALLVPSKVIKKYANYIADSIFSYLLFRDSKFQFELFDSNDESEENIINTLREIHHKGYNLVIAAVTQNGARMIVKHEKSMQVYIPTINKKEINLMRENISFGGIDYEEQIDRLLVHAGERVAIFSDKSALSKKLENYVDNASFSEISYRKTIKNAKANLTPFIKDNSKLENASIFLNMPIVKSSLLASQLSVNDAGYKNILLTQISYNPLLFTLTQAKDRADMYIANSVGHSDFRLKDINLILGENLDFSWVNYSTDIGVDYLVSNFTEAGYEKIFSEHMVNNQIKYNIDILKPANLSFESVKN